MSLFLSCQVMTSPYHWHLLGPALSSKCLWRNWRTFGGLPWALGPMGDILRKNLETEARFFYGRGLKGHICGIILIIATRLSVWLIRECSYPIPQTIFVFCRQMPTIPRLQGHQTDFQGGTVVISSFYYFCYISRIGCCHTASLVPVDNFFFHSIYP